MNLNSIHRTGTTSVIPRRISFESWCASKWRSVTLASRLLHILGKDFYSFIAMRIIERIHLFIYLYLLYLNFLTKRLTLVISIVQNCCNEKENVICSKKNQVKDNNGECNVIAWPLDTFRISGNAASNRNIHGTVSEQLKKNFAKSRWRVGINLSMINRLLILESISSIYIYHSYCSKRITQPQSYGRWNGWR